LNRLVAPLSLAAMALAVLALFGWLSGFQILARFDSAYIPMAPSTAVILIIFSAALLFERTKIGAAVKISASTAVLLFLALNRLFDLERFLVSSPEMLGAAPVGRLAPLTELNFILLGLGLFLFGLKRKNRRAEGVLFVSGFLINAAVLTGYLYGLPFFYGGASIPMALNTALALICLASAAILAIGPADFPLSYLAGTGARPLVLRWFAPILFFTVILQGYLYTRLPFGTINFALNSFILALLIIAVLAAGVTYISRLIGSELDRTQALAIESETRFHQDRQKSEARFRTLSEQSPNMIFINYRGKIVYANQCCSEVTGYSPGELLSPDFDFRSLTAPTSLSVFEAALKKHLQGEDVEPYECELVKKNGEKFAAIISTKLIDYENDRAILGVITDISAQRQTEADLKKKLGELELFKEAAIGRELKMIDQEKEIDSLLIELERRGGKINQ